MSLKNRLRTELDPRHCHYNPTELVWVQVKQEVAKRNKTFTRQKLIKGELDTVTREDWASCERRVENL
jgi:hypothetical protein